MTFHNKCWCFLVLVTVVAISKSTILKLASRSQFYHLHPKIFVNINPKNYHIQPDLLSLDIILVITVVNIYFV